MSKAISQNTTLSGAAHAESIDPIFAALEAHREAHVALSAAVALSGVLLPGQSDCESAEAATAVTHERSIGFGIALTDVVPTTMQGVIALLDYVDAFNRSAVPGVTSDCNLWPDDLIDDDVKTAKGHALETPWAFWIMRNVATALRNIAAQS